MVSTAHWLISETGVKVLRDGGNAIDASVAMALSAGVVSPDMCSIGGDAFMLYYHKEAKNYMQSMGVEKYLNVMISIHLLNSTE